LYEWDKEEWNDTWAHVVHGDTFAGIVRRAVDFGRVYEVRAALVPWEPYASRRNHWERILLLLALAEMAALTRTDIPASRPGALTEIEKILQRTDPNYLLDDPWTGTVAQLDDREWRRFLARQLDRVRWPVPLSSAWAQDFLGYLLGEGKPTVVEAQRIGVLMCRSQDTI
jgi:hypothetical protein